MASRVASGRRSARRNPARARIPRTPYHHTAYPLGRAGRSPAQSPCCRPWRAPGPVEIQLTGGDRADVALRMLPYGGWRRCDRHARSGRHPPWSPIRPVCAHWARWRRAWSPASADTRRARGFTSPHHGAAPRGEPGLRRGGGASFHGRRVGDDLAIRPLVGLAAGAHPLQIAGSDHPAARRRAVSGPADADGGRAHAQPPCHRHPPAPRSAASVGCAGHQAAPAHSVPVPDRRGVGLCAAVSAALMRLPPPQGSVAPGGLSSRTRT